MAQLTNEEIAKVFAMYIPCQVIDNGKLYELDGFLKREKELIFFTIDKEFGLVERSGLYHDFKLSLTPLPSITDEHAVEVAKIALHNSAWTTQAGKGWLKLTLNNEVMRDGFRYGPLPANVFQYLISEGYAVPIFFGIDHWANGKTAIELGIAIDKTLTY